MKVITASLAALTLFLGPSSSAQPNTTTGSVSGVVLDASGAPLPDAFVVLDNPLAGVHRGAATNQAGIFEVGALPPGRGYSITISKPWFAPFERTGIEILPGGNVRLTVPLERVTFQTQIQVAEIPTVESSSTGVSQVVESAQIAHLPINGRVDSFVLTPAVAPASFLTDGNRTANPRISQDAVQEFQVTVSGSPAEFGGASGGVVNTLTRSGSNDLQGTAYWYFRNRAFNARDPYSGYNPPEWRHQAGASLGGKIREDLFYFFNHEATERRYPLVASLARPPLFDSLGRFTGSCQATAEQCSAALRFLDRHFQVLDRTASSQSAFGRLDWRPTGAHSVTAGFNYLGWHSPNGERSEAVLTDGSGIGNNADSSVRTRHVRVSWIAILPPALTIETRFGWFQDRLLADLNGQLIPRETGRTQIGVEGQSNLGVGSDFPRLGPNEDRFQLANTIGRMAGRHSWKFGGEWVRARDYRVGLSNREGTYNYATFTAFAQDFSGNVSGRKRWQSYSQRFGTATQATAGGEYNFFAQDQLRWSEKLTLNYGLRYEYARWSSPPALNSVYPETARIPSPARNFAPRLGAAYAIGPKTVLRAGYGQYYGRMEGGLINTLFLGNGLYQTSITLDGGLPRDLAAGPVFPNRLTTFDPARTYGASDLSFASNAYRNPYSQQGDIGIEREFSPDLGLTVSYLWNRGLHLTTTRDNNIGELGPPMRFLFGDGRPTEFSTPAYLLANRVDPLWRRINVIESGGKSYYNALAVQLRKRASRGLQGSIAYTWSKAEDFGQGGGSGAVVFNQGPRSLFNGDYAREKSRSDLDQRHRLVLVSIYEFQGPASGGWLGRHLARGWQLSQISTFTSPQPVSPVVFVSGAPFPGAAFNTTMNGFGGSTRVPFLPANSLDVDSVARTDARVTRKVRLSDRVTVLLNFEAFNVLNRVSNTSVNTQAFMLQRGVLTPTPGLGQGAASAGSPDGTNARRAQVSLRLLF